MMLAVDPTSLLAIAAFATNYLLYWLAQLALTGN